jgi:hypothetical protein
MASRGEIMNDYFYFFGCWNQGFCNLNDGSSSPLSQLIINLKEKLSGVYKAEFKVPLLIVAGDNYYPFKIKDKIGGAALTEPSKEKLDKKKDKSKEYKIFNKAFLDSGMACILSLGDYFQKIYMLMGNHDLQYEKKLYLYDASINGKGEQADKCEIISAQMKPSYEEHFNYDHNHYLDPEHPTLILFVNSSMYTNASKDLFECMKIYRPEIYGRAQTIRDIIDIDERSINNVINGIEDKESIKNILICGHEPIVSLKIKKGKPLNPELKDGLPETGEEGKYRGINFFHNIYSQFPSAEKYYLCADVHNYQEGIIEFKDEERTKVTQYVVGTGGTELDMYNYDEDYLNQDVEFSTGPLDFSFRLEKYELEFGYLNCRKEGTGLNFKFDSVVYNGWDCKELTKLGGCTRGPIFEISTDNPEKAEDLLAAEEMGESKKAEDELAVEEMGESKKAEDTSLTKEEKDVSKIKEPLAAEDTGGKKRRSKKNKKKKKSKKNKKRKSKKKKTRKRR